jgi:hypothetical protein
MKIKTVEIKKNMKIGLPNFSNIDVGCGITFEVADGEEVVWDDAWNEVNRQLSLQVQGTDPSWMESKEYGNFFKVTAKIPKR